MPGNGSPSPVPSNYVSRKNLEAGGSPAFVAEDSTSRKNVEAPPAETNTCVHCHQPTPNKYRCDPCIAESERLNGQRWAASA